MKLLSAGGALASLFCVSYAQEQVATVRGALDRNLQSIAVTSLQLMNTKTNAVIATIAPGATIKVPSGTPLNIKAVVSGPVGSVQFGYETIANLKIESSAPFAFCGDNGGVLWACALLKAGTHTVTATPFSGTGATGSKGTPYSRKFTIVSSGSTPVARPPAPSPVQPTPSGPTSTHSSWISPIKTPVIAAGAAHLANGQILLWSSKERTNFGLDTSTATWTAIYNPSTGRISEQYVTNTAHDMFCSGTTVLSNGVIMISGGANSKSTTFYDHGRNTWSVGPQMKLPRGYQAHTLLANGEVFSFGGSWSGVGADKDGEVWSPQNNSWRLLTGVPSKPAHTGDSGGRYRADNHYWLFLAPNGKVFHAGPSKQMHWITTSGSGSLVASIRRGDDDDAMNGNAVMYDIGKVLTVGGAKNYADGSASKRAYIIDINGSEASVKRTSDMKFARSLVNSVVLPNGEVVVIGGMSAVKLFSDDSAVLEAEIWSPSTQSFKTLKRMQVPRNYHSVALIMQDGRVWAAGGGLCGGCSVNHQDFEILTPPYLFNTDGSLASRPSIQSSPGSAKAGNVITVTTNSSGSHTFALVKLSAVTHSVNNDQRRVPLSTVSKDGATFSLKIPDNKNVALPGYYFLFAMNSNGVPSVAKTIRIDL